MDAKYTVHRCAMTQAPTAATLADGRKVDATVDVFVVELVGADGLHGTTMLRFLGEEIAEAKATFVQGATILGQFVPVNS